MEEITIALGLICVQVYFAFYGVFLSQLLSNGFNPLFIVTCVNLTTFFFLCPFAISMERSKWPRKFKPSLLIQLLLMALGGVTIFQGLTLVGIKKTSPSIASAMPNLAPGLIFIIAWALRLEKIDLKCIYSRFKIIGTFVCVVGTILMSLLHGPSSSSNKQNSALSSKPQVVDLDQLLGCFCLFAAVLSLSFSVVIQATAMIELPAPLSLCSITSLLGSVLTMFLELILEGNLSPGSRAFNLLQLSGLTLSGGVCNGICIAFQTWCVKKKGPVVVAIFSPIGSVCCAVLSAITLGEAATLGSVTGMILMFTGLYFVLWAKKNEDNDIPEDEYLLPRDTSEDLLR